MNQAEQSKYKVKIYKRRGCNVKGIDIVQGKLKDAKTILETYPFKRQIVVDLVDDRYLALTDLKTNKKMFDAYVGDTITFEDDKHTILKWNSYAFRKLHK